MTPLEIRTAIQQVLGTVPYQAPVNVAYCAAVRDALRPLVLGAECVEVYHKLTELVVEVWHGKTRERVAVKLP